MMSNTCRFAVVRSLMVPALAGAMATQASAEIMASEDFGDRGANPDPALPPLDDSTGFGWDGGWTTANGDGGFRSSITSLDRSNGFDPSLGDTGFLRVGNRTGRNLDTSDEGPFADYLDPFGTIGKDGTTLYVAVIFGTTAPDTNYYGLEIHREGINDAARIIQVASELGSSENRALDLRAYNQDSGAENIWTQTTSVGDYFVLRFDFGENDEDTVTLYINPQYNQPESASTPIASISGTDFAFDRISFAQFGGSNSFVDFDDIRVATTWEAVAGELISDPYALWAAGAGLDGTPGFEAGFDDDPDGDGLANGLEWILGGDPLSPADGALVEFSHDTEDGLVLAFDREPAAIGAAVLKVLYSATLEEGSWQEVVIGEESSEPDANGVVVNVDDEETPHRVTVSIPATNGGDGRLFARLEAERP